MNKHETDVVLSLLLVVEPEGFNHRFLDGLRKSNPTRLNIWQTDTLSKIAVQYGVEHTQQKYQEKPPHVPIMIIHSVIRGKEIPSDAVGIELKEKKYDPNEVFERVSEYAQKLNCKIPTEVWMLRTDCYFRKEK